ncbi:hypothetical protein SAMN04487911_11954 [Arenibacter nanhaiticus]|uniref:Uncharacterized protein n=1 Tax=Arenibacter nanhaiticus TaxID=558155 RepID=A0A1M6IX13_9FLAO|nr:hypothetical protein [Arenibacter nanhaiticus]SHJ39025.1 hypothetical protein SAMN04487911_11954 [Arenibacter nanhaiticus]
MTNTINCTNCGADIDYNTESCYCGFSMSNSDKEEALSQIRQIESVQLLDESIGNTAIDYYQALDNFELSSSYFRSKTAKKDFTLKVDFINENLKPAINLWRTTLTEAELQIAKEKLEVYKSMYEISDFIINEFFGRFKLKDYRAEYFNEVRNYSQYEIAETMVSADLDFSDIETTNLGAIGANVLSSGFNALQNGSFNELAQKSEWTKSDQKRVATEVGVSIAIGVLDGVGKLLTQNSEVIKQIRAVNLELNNEMEKVGSTINEMLIEERGLRKHKRLYDWCEIILNRTFTEQLLPIVNELNSNPIYQEYRYKRKPFDLEQDKIQISHAVLNEEVDLSFWGILFRSKRSNFSKAWSRRIKKTNLASKFDQLNKDLNESTPRTLNELLDYQTIRNENFEKFESTHRKEIRAQDVYNKNRSVVEGYAKVFKNIQEKLNINKI